MELQSRTRDCLRVLPDVARSIARSNTCTHMCASEHSRTSILCSRAAARKRVCQHASVCTCKHATRHARTRDAHARARDC
eukprot:3335736-Pleurochrysis_carterae.AAC.1